MGLANMLSATSQYAIRALTYLAAQKNDVTVGGPQLSRQTGIPRNYLSKILVTLVNAGIVDAARGVGGGYRLSSPPDEIRLVRVVELFDRHVTKRGCLLGLRPVCSDEDPCTAHHAWKNAKNAFFDFLECTSLRDISPATRVSAPARPAKRRSVRRDRKPGSARLGSA